MTAIHIEPNTDRKFTHIDFTVRKSRGSVSTNVNHSKLRVVLRLNAYERYLIEIHRKEKSKIIIIYFSHQISSCGLHNSLYCPNKYAYLYSHRIVIKDF